MKIFKDWRNRDWCWSISILIGIIIIIITWRLNDKDNVVNIISMFASGASIILALVAIVQSTIFNNSTNELNARMTEKLSLLENNMELVKNNILNNAIKAIDNAPIEEKLKENIKYNIEESVDYQSSRKNDINKVRAFERTFVNKIIHVYGNNYQIRYQQNDSSLGVDVLLENDKQIVLLEIKVTEENLNLSSFNRMKSYIQNYQMKLQTTKNIVGKMIIIGPALFSHINIEDVIFFTPIELLEISDDEFKNKMDI